MKLAHRVAYELIKGPIPLGMQLAAMLDTNDLNHWERGFVCSVNSWSRNGTDTHRLSDEQIETVEKIYRQHFGDAE